MMGRYGYGYDTTGGTWVGDVLMLLFMALVVAGIVVLIVWVVRSSGGHGHAGPQMPAPHPGHDEAIAIAKKRLASGEIDKNQYDEIMRALGG